AQRGRTMQQQWGRIHEVLEAAREGAAERAGDAPDVTGSWHFSRGCCPRRGAEPVAGADSSSFSPRAAITTGSALLPISEVDPVLRARLRALPMIYILVLTMATIWRCAILRDDDRVLHYLDASVIAALGSVIALLSSGWPVSLGWFRALELGMV